MDIGFFPQKEDNKEFKQQQQLNREQQEYDYATSTSPEEQMMAQAGMPSPDLTRWQQDVDPYLQKMILKLKRQYVGEGGKLQTIDGLEPLCSDECVENILGLLQANTTPNTMLSKFTESQISNMQIQLERTLILDVLIPERKKHATSLAYLSQVKKIFRSFALPTFFRSLGGFESINQRQIRTIKELRSDRPQEKKTMFGMGG
jgi:hypothetical protein